MRAKGIRIGAIENPGGGATLEHTTINLTHPERSAILRDNLARTAGGRAPDATAPFRTIDDPDFAALLAAIREGGRLLEEKPRMDMPGGVPVPQKRQFGIVFGAPRPETAKATP